MTCTSEARYEESPFYSKELQQESGCSLSEWKTLFSPRHGTEKSKITQETHTTKAGQENIWSRVASVQNIAGTQKASMLAGSWHYLYTSREVCENGVFSSFSSLLIERAFIMLTL